MIFESQKKQESKELETAREYNHNENLINAALPQNGEDDYLKEQQDISKADLVRWQQDLSEEATAFVMDIMGYYKDEDSSAWVKDKDAEPLANAKFIRRIKPLLKLATSRNLMMTNFSDERVRRSLQRASMKYTDLIYFHWKTFGIDKRDCGYLVEQYKQLIEPTVYRSFNNGERNYLNTINKRIETYTDKPQEPKKSLLGI